MTNLFQISNAQCYNMDQRCTQRENRQVDFNIMGAKSPLTCFQISLAANFSETTTFQILMWHQRGV